MTEEERREMTRSNYAAQLSAMGYGPDGMAQPKTTEWHKLNKQSLPPVGGPRFLLMRGYREKGGGVLCVAQRDEYGIRYVGGEKGWKYLPDEEYRSSVWQPVELPGEQKGG